MYDIEGFFFNNPINRYGIGNMDEKIQPDADCGPAITIQQDSPASTTKRTGCPPAEGFFMVVRL